MEVAHARIKEWNPGDLDTLDLSHLNLSKLPEIPDYVTRLDCSFNNISEIYVLPKKLEYLNCSNNRLKTLPKLPKSLRYLNLTNNPISEREISNLNLHKSTMLIWGEDIKLNFDKKMHDGKCFDWNLLEEHDVISYLISSKDNIIINMPHLNGEKMLCYSKKIFKNNEMHMISDEEYYTFPHNDILKNIIISRKTLNYLMNPKYQIYNFKKVIDKSFTTENIFGVESYQLKDLR
jgi:Leucine-rich repeat (LRR) protein